jgi:hypothetical protein
MGLFFVVLFLILAPILIAAAWLLDWREKRGS